MFEDSVTYQFIGNVERGAITDIMDLPEGAVAIVDENNDPQDSVSDGDRIRIAQKANGQFIYSPYFVAGEAEVNKYDYEADTQQVTYLGLNGDDEGELDATAGATYTLGVNLLHTAGILNNTPQIKTIPAYNKSGEQHELATTLLKSFNKMMKVENRQPIKAERIYNGSTTAATNGANNAELSVVKGSYAVEAANSPTTGEPSAGDWIYIPDGGDDVAYKVVEVNSDVYTLDMPYAGESGTISDEGWGVIDDEDTGDWGIRFTGQAVDPNSFDVVTETHRNVEFKLSWDRVDAPSGADADPTTVTYDTKPQVGRGTFMDVGVREVYTTMNEGNPFISAYPPTNYRRKADPDNEYDVFVINATDTGYTSPTTGQKPVSKYNIYVAIDDSLSDDIGYFDTI